MLTSYIDQHFMPDERLIALSRIHWLALVPAGIVAALGLVLAALGLVLGSVEFAVIGIVTAVIAGLFVLALLEERLSTEFSCTDRRILIKSGLLATHLREMPLAQVEALFMRQGLFGKIFGYGTVVFSGSGGTKRTCKNVEAPFDFYSRVQEAVAAVREHR